MLREWEREHPGRLDNMSTALGNVVPSHLLDRKLYPFTTLQTTGMADRDGDKAFDDERRRGLCADRAARDGALATRRPQDSFGVARRGDRSSRALSTRHRRRLDMFTDPAGMLAVVLAGCAATRLDANVHTIGNWPAGRAPGSFAFERLPSQMAQASEQDELEAETLPALAPAGFSSPGASPSTCGCRWLRARCRGRRSPRTRSSARRLGRAGLWGGPARGGLGLRRGLGLGPGWGFTYYVFEVAVLILDARTEQSLYETRAHSDGASPDEGTWAALARPR